MYRSGLSSQATRTDVKFGYSWPEKEGVNIFWRGIWFLTFEKFCDDNNWHNIPQVLTIEFKRSLVDIDNAKGVQ